MNLTPDAVFSLLKYAAADVRPSFVDALDAESTTALAAEVTKLGGNSEVTKRALEWLGKAEWTGEHKNDLPDEAFAYVSPGGSKDEDGKTVPRSNRHLPYKNAKGEIDVAHLRNALSRLPQTDIPASAKASAQRKLDAAAREADVGET